MTISSGSRMKELLEFSGRRFEAAVEIPYEGDSIK